METALRSAVSHFSEAPLRNGKVMRELIAESYQNFRTAAVSVLREPSDVRGCRYLVTVLWTHDLLMPILGDCTLPKELVRSIAQTAAKVDPQLHLRLIRFLVTGMLEGKELAESSANRLLEVLGSVADGPGIHRFIRQMLQHPSARIRSKVTLLVERGGPGIRSLVNLLEDKDEDARVRANAIEALWSVDSPELPALFKNCMGDPNNRVAGNATLALYLLGEPQSIRKLFDMSASPEPLVQTTALWTMGRTKDPRFLLCAGRAMLASKGMVRRTAFNALESIKKTAAERAKGPQVAVHILGVQTVDAAVQVRASLTYPASAKPVEARPTSFLIQLDAEPVIDFTCQKQQNTLLCIAVVIPVRAVADPVRSLIDSTVKLCLESKTMSEQWGVAGYQERGGPLQEIQSGRLLGQSMESMRSPANKSKAVAFSSNVATIRASLDAATTSRDVPSNAFDTLRDAFSAPMSPRAVRHAILFVDADLRLGGEAVEHLITDANAARFAISILSTSDNLGLARVCAETRGTFRVLPQADALQSELLLIYASIRSQYIFEIPSTRPAGTLPKRVSLSVHAEAGIGEAVWNRSADSEIPATSDPAPQL